MNQMQVSVDDLYAEIGRLIVTIRVHETQKAELRARISELEMKSETPPQSPATPAGES